MPFRDDFERVSEGQVVFFSVQCNLSMLFMRFVKTSFTNNNNYFFYLCFQEHDNEAETVISSLANNYDDDELDIGKQTSPSETMIWM